MLMNPEGTRTRTNRWKWRRRRRSRGEEGIGKKSMSWESSAKLCQLSQTRPSMQRVSEVSIKIRVHVHPILTTLQAKGLLHPRAVRIYRTVLASVELTSTLTLLMGFSGMTMSYLGITEALFMWKAVQYFHPSTPVSALWYGWVHRPFPLIDRWTYTTRCTPGYSAVEANYFWAGYFLEFIYCPHSAAHPLSIAHSLSHSLTPVWLGQAKLNRKKCGSQVHWIGTGITWMDRRDVTVAIFPSFTPLHFTLPPLVLPGGTHHPSSPPSFSVLPPASCFPIHVWAAPLCCKLNTIGHVTKPVHSGWPAATTASNNHTNEHTQCY